MKIELREYKKEDYETIKNIIRKTWNYDQLTDSKTANKLAKVFLDSCLNNYTFSRVALQDEKVIGIILLNDIKKHKFSFRKTMKQFKSVTSLLLSKKGRQVCKLFGNISGLDNELLKENNKKYQAELSLFAIDENARGLGIGKMLFNEVLNNNKKDNITDFYLFTDTSCNYGFYEHQGMKRCIEKDKKVVVNNQESIMKFFIYEYGI